MWSLQKAALFFHIRTLKLGKLVHFLAFCLRRQRAQTRSLATYACSVVVPESHHFCFMG